MTKRGLPSGVAPSRLSTWYSRWNAVPIPRLTRLDDMIARARIPGTRKLSWSPGADRTLVTDRKTSKPTGMPSVSRRVSPLRKVIRVSAAACASNAFISARPPPDERRPLW